MGNLRLDNIDNPALKHQKIYIDILINNIKTITLNLGCPIKSIYKDNKFDYNIFFDKDNSRITSKYNDKEFEQFILNVKKDQSAIYNYGRDTDKFIFIYKNKILSIITNYMVINMNMSDSIIQTLHQIREIILENLDKNIYNIGGNYGDYRRL
jgi:hypothetical protein